jgi:hypothetical protein
MTKNKNARQPVQTMRPATIDNGEEVRTAVTDRQNQTSTQPENDVLAAIGDDETASNIAKLRPSGSRTNVFNQTAMDISHQAAAKMQHMGEARQKLAEAKDLSSKGEDFAVEAQETAASAIALLYQARVNGEVSAEEVSSALGDTFGYKPKKDGSPGKTPAGLGEPIRKRIVRLSQAAQFATSEDGSPEDVSTFFKGMDKGDVAQVLNEVENKNLSPWRAYERFAEMKREASEKRVNPAFDAKRVASMAAALTEAGAVDNLISDPGLWAAYGTLINVLRVVGEDDRLIAAYEASKAEAA